MSEVEVLPPPSPLRTENMDTAQDEDAIENAEEGAQGENIEAEVNAEDQPIDDATPEEEKSVQQIDEEKSAQPVEEDRTEDQVPDITGTENVDPMTTSMDGIEELPTNEDEQNVEEPVEAKEQTEEAAGNTGDVTAEEEPSKEPEEEVPQPEVVEPVAEPEADAAPTEEPEEKAASPQPEAQEEAVVEEAPEQAAEDTVIETEVLDASNEAAVEPEEPKAEEAEEAPAVEEEPSADAEADAAPAEPTEEQGTFELQAPPTPKRPRTPNDLDNVEPAVDEQHVVQADDAALTEVQSPQVATPTAKTPSKPGTPATPKTPKSRKTSSTAAPSVSNGSIPGTPKSAAISAAEEPATPRSGAVAPRADAIEEKIPEQDEKVEQEAAAEPESVPEPQPAAEVDQEPEKEVSEVEKVPEETVDEEPAVEKVEQETSQAEKTPEVEVTQEHEETGAHVEEEPVVAEVEEAKEEPVAEPERHIVEAKVDMEEAAPPHRERRQQSPSPPPRRAERSPSPVRRQRSPPTARTYANYDQDSHRSRGPPPRMPSYSSFSSYTPAEKSTYSPISPWVQNAQKYRNEYTATSNYRPPSTYTSQFDDIVNTGAFSTSLYSANRLLERSRSRTRERKTAMRSQRSASNYYRYTSSYGTAPIRSRDYSTPPLSAVHRPPSRSGSFISFMEYSGAKQYELARSRSRSAAFDSSSLSRSSSRSNNDLYLGAGRLSRVDSYVHDLNHRYEWQVPSSYSKYRSSSRSYLPQDYSPVNGYTSYNNSTYINTETTQRMKRYARDVAPNVRSMYESRIGELERSLSRERLARDRMKNKYTELSSKLEQACKQMDLLRTNSYSSIRGGTARISVYSHLYPYY